jgi:hypothetical protein
MAYFVTIDSFVYENRIRTQRPEGRQALGHFCTQHRLRIRLSVHQPTLMFAFKGQRAVFYSAAADCADCWCAQQETRPEDAG